MSDPATLDDARGFSLRMALFRFLTPNARVTLLEHRRANLVARLREIRSNAANAELDTYARSVMEHGAKAVELDLAWIDECLATERTIAVPQNNQTIAQEAK